jgi:hypothetical protein
LKEGAVIASRFKAKALELRCGPGGGDVLVAGGAAAAVEFVGGEKVFIGTDAWVAEGGAVGGMGRATKGCEE